MIMLLYEALAELMVKLAPNIYRKYVIVSIKGKLLLYVQIQKVLYGLLHSTLLFYINLVDDLDAYGFYINPYHPCASKNMINDKQMIVLLHVNNLKV